MRPRLCIVVPVLNEASALVPLLATLQPLRNRGARVVIVDGGSSDETLTVALAHGDIAFRGPRGRALQMNAGAAACRADVLLFLHADTRLPEDADTLILDAIAQGSAWGRFDVQIETHRATLRLVEGMMNLRSRVTGIATGDQALFVRVDTFDEVDGFPPIPLMEDVALSRKLKRLGRPACLRAKVVTSARRWNRDGIWRTIFLMWGLRAAFFFGIDPGRLARHYGNARRET